MSKSWIPPQGEYISTDGIVIDNTGTTLTSKLASIDSSLTAIVPVSRGGTGANSATTARTNLGLGNMGISNNGEGTENLTTGTKTTLVSVTLSAGSYILMGGCSFAANSSGVRALAWSTTNNEISDAGVRQNGMKVLAGNSGVTALTAIQLVTLNKSTTYYLVAQQNSGSTLSTTGYYRYIRIK